jgi:competence protein ComEC
MSSIVKNFKYYFLGVLFLGAVFAWYAVLAETRNGLKVAFLDVGQGDAIFVEAPNGNQILIDGGPNKSVLRELSKQMPFYDRSIDAIILTHPHLDHYGGLVDALDNYKINLEMDSGNNNPGSLGFDLYIKKLAENKVRRVLARRGMRINLDRETYLDVLFPVTNKEGLSPHDEMVVTRLVYGKNSFFLTGDMEDNLENYLLSLGGNFKSDVLKVGHHGSKTSTSESFLGWVSPSLAVISVGKGNKYGHPHKEVTDRLAKFRIPTLRTDEKGTVVLKSDGEKILVK